MYHNISAVVFLPKGLDFLKNSMSKRFDMAYLRHFIHLSICPLVHFHYSINEDIKQTPRPADLGSFCMYRKVAPAVGCGWGIERVRSIRIYKSKTINTSEYTLELYFSVSLNPTLRYKAIAFVLVDKESRNIFV